MIRFQNFRKSYGNTPILHIPDTYLEAGIYWIKGVNGSGKSTLLKSMAGMLACGGDILIDKDISLKNQPIQYRRVVNFSEAEPLFPEFITGLEMIDLFVSAKNASAKQKDELIESMKMGTYINGPVKSYSSGMLKKLSLLLAFLGSPHLILLDEPLITVDIDSLKILYNWIEYKRRTEGTTFLITSHQNLDYDRLPETRALLIENQTLRFVD